MTEAANPRSPETLEIDVSVPCPLWTEALADSERLSREAAAAAYKAAGDGPGPAEASIVLADDAFVRGLNREYRNQDKPTNVLAFPADTPMGGPADGLVGGAAATVTGAPRMLGDIVVAYETASREAADQMKPLGDHLCHLAVHGMLHLLGHDHRTASQAATMEKLEIDVLAGLEIANPYSGDSTANAGN